MSRIRSVENSSLPPYVMRRSGRFYLEPKGALLERLNGKKSWPLGKTYMEMFSRYKDLMDSAEIDLKRDIHTMAQLIDRYLLEVTPTKSESGQKPEIRRCNLLKHVFGQMHPSHVTKVDIYGYIDWRTETGAPVGVNREVALLSAIFKKGQRWGVVEDNPVLGVERNPESPRTRYVTNDEYLAFREFAAARNPVVAAYMDFKYLTGLRGNDIRSLKKSSFTTEGICLKINKTGRAGRPPKEVMIDWSSKLGQATRNLIEACGREKINENGIVERERVESNYLLHTRTGDPYTLDGWCSIFYRLMKKAVDEGVLSEPFKDHDIRAKASSDHETLEGASRFLAHSSVGITAKHYRRKIERIQPLM